MFATYHPTNPIAHQRDLFTQPVTALSFDPTSDTLWSGSNTGQIVAHYGTRGMHGVSFKVGGNLAVKKIVTGDSYVRAVGIGSEGVGSWSKGGVNKWYYRSPISITTFTNVTHGPHSVAAASTAPELVLLNANTGQVIRQAPVLSIISHIQSSHRSLLSGSLDGFIRLYDPRTGMRRENGAEGVIRPHLSGVQGLQTSGNFVFTIGLGMRHSRPFPDPLVKVYDLRTMRPLPPVPFSSGPAFINTLPRRPSSIVIASTQGLVNIVDVSNPNIRSEFYQLDLSSYLNSTAVSPTGAYLAFGDAEGVIHLMTSSDEHNPVPFNGFDGEPPEWADPPDPLPEIEWTDSTPLNVIGLPFYTTLLLSSWTPKFIPPTSPGTSALYYPPPAKIPPQILSTMKTNDNIAYAVLPRELKGRRNVVSTAERKGTARFRSKMKGKGDDGAEPETPTDGPVYDRGESIPRAYNRVEIEYSKFGVEDFDFGFYNKTPYSGLESHILNSYTNSLVQVMHYTLPIRRLAKSHIATNCPREHCLLCELGFVARMLEDAAGINCQSSNFCRSVGVLAQTSNAIELIDYGREAAETDYAHMIQSFHRFLVDHLSSEGNSFPYNPVLLPSVTASEEAAAKSVTLPAPAPVTQLLGIVGKNVITCLNCKAVREKENMTHIVDLVYPRKVPSNEPAPASDFSSILRTSLLRQMTHTATCQSCKAFSKFASRREMPTRDLPPVLAVNASLRADENLRYWLDGRPAGLAAGRTGMGTGTGIGIGAGGVGVGRFLRPRVVIKGQVDGVDDPDGATYELRALIVQVVPKDRHSHLVAIIKVPGVDTTNGASPWYVFNDFVVRNVSEDEALGFPDKWKIPAVLYLERIDRRDVLDYSGLPDEIDAGILSRDTSISLNRDKHTIKHDVLRAEELPKPGMLVAIDAEFVSMQQEETEFRSDGTTKVLRPARLSLARVSVLRGDGPKQRVPFIDDHIHTSEVIVDYLTEFSGIKYGDLDPHLSRYTLTPLKLVYKKLRILVDCGCIFIGHGLSKDFRIINIFVPPEQVIDTVDLYFLKARQRRLSLRFLSWFVLHEHIQQDTHDSIEDARSALMLYKAYHEFEERGEFDQKLEELYREGKLYNWKPPPAPGATSRTPSPSNNDGSGVPLFSLTHASNMLQASYPHTPFTSSPGNFFVPGGMYGQNWNRHNM